MSAYGSVVRPARPAPPRRLPTTAWSHPRDPSTTLTLFHLDSPSAIAEAPGLFDHLHAVFADEVDKGLTYPQEDMREPDAFRAYFFAADVVVAVVTTAKSTSDLTLNSGLGPPSNLVSDLPPNPEPPSNPASSPMPNPGPDLRASDEWERRVAPREVQLDIERARAGRTWDECVAGFYYVKPNYPGRSSHICNAGFVVPPSHRAGGHGRVLARSYLYYAPRLGYEASVFNLVYINNVASVRLWERLGFIKAGLIPRAGRLKRTDGPGEEYVDAWVFYKRFDDEKVKRDVTNSTS